MATGISYSYDSDNRLTQVVFNDGATVDYSYDSAGNRTAAIEAAASCLAQFTIISKSANFTASDGPGSFYRISGNVTVTMPASAADGSVYKFKVLSGSATFAFNGSQVFNHANGQSDQSLVLTSNSGVLEMISVSNGYDET